jgi:hypothetical protein
VFRIVFWDILPCKMMMEAVRTSETSVDNHFTRQYIPEDNSEHHTSRRENLKSQTEYSVTGDPLQQGAYIITFQNSRVQCNWRPITIHRDYPIRAICPTQLMFLNLLDLKTILICSHLCLGLPSRFLGFPIKNL